MGLAAIAAMMLATSCANEDLKDPNAGTPGTYTFDVKIAQSIGSRSQGLTDGSQATTLIYQVYNSDGSTFGQQKTLTNFNFSGQSQITIDGLAVDGNYTIAFWAQNPECTAFITSNLNAVGINYSYNNNTDMDAFCGRFAFSGATGGHTTVTLRRPFSQINVGVPTEVEYTTSAVTLTAAEENVLCNTLNVATGEATATGDLASDYEIEFEAAALPTEQLSANNGTYYYISTTFVLINNEGLVDVALQVNGSDFYASPFDGIPVKTNYRTNILGEEQEVPQGKFIFTVHMNADYENDNVENFDGESDGPISISEVNAEYEDGAVNLSATYTPANLTVTAAGFYLVPSSAVATLMFGRADDAPVTIPQGAIQVVGKAENGNLTATYEDEDDELQAGETYYAWAYINSTVASNNETEGDHTFDVPSTEEPDSYIYIVGVGQGLGWDLPGMPVQLSDGVYTVIIQDLESFKFSSVDANDWNAFNSGAYLTNDTFTSNVLNTGGQTLSLRSVTEQDGENNINTPWKGTYTVTISADFQTITLFTETPEPAGDPASIWVVGEGTLNGNTTLSFTLPGEEVSGTTTNITFTLSNCIKFKFSTNQSTEWDNAGNFNDGALAPTAGFTTAVYPDGQLLNLEQNSSDIILPEGADFTITVNLTAKTMLVKASQAVTLNTPSMYIRGASFGWNAGDCTSVNELKAIEYNATTGAGTWKIENVTIDAGAEFKIADNAWGNLNYSSGTSVSNFSDPVTLNYNGNNMSLSQNFTGSIIVTVPKLKEQATAVFTVQ